ncbi:transmembrane ascorbate-dependent reductase CYB561-like isoform X2 [Petromyzon marinus]|uniref:transmembrane ascorbate-dependent reductase CYB561-like isoform X2 n=1 Tax=Petromyzon marinus TaxID=7757 RepID=UPI003F6F177F
MLGNERECRGIPDNDTKQPSPSIARRLNSRLSARTDGTKQEIHPAGRKQQQQRQRQQRRQQQQRRTDKAERRSGQTPTVPGPDSSGPGIVGFEAREGAAARVGPSMEETEPPGGALRRLPWLVATSQLLGLLCVALGAVWTAYFRGGFAWEGDLLFNVHPLCMVIGMVFLYGEAILIFRIFRNEVKKSVKIIHGIVHVGALIAAIIGLVAVFDFHQTKGFPHLYSLHSWCGLGVVILYFVQWLLGFGFFLFPRAAPESRSAYRSIHTFFGLALFVLSVATATMGLTEKLIYAIGDRYGEYPAEGILANCLGLALIGFGAAVAYVVTRDEWRYRRHDGEEAPLSLHFQRFSDERAD